MKEGIKLNVLERIKLMDILPKEGNLIYWKILKGLKEKISFTEEGITNYSIKVTDGKIFWNPQQDSGKDFELSDAEKGIIIDAFKKLNEQNKITEDILSLAEKFL